MPAPYSEIQEPEKKLPSQDASDIDALAKGAVMAILSHSKFHEIWSRQHYTHSHENPASEILADLSSDSQLHVEKAFFIRELALLELKALGKAHLDKDVEAYELSENLSLLVNYLEHTHPELKAFDRSVLSQGEIQALSTLENEFLLKPFKPHKSVWNFFKLYAGEIKKEAKAEPWVFGPTLAVALGVGYLMTSKISASSTYIDPKLIGLAETLSDSNNITYDSGLNASAIDLSGSCHEHLRQLWPQAADALTSIGIQLPQHCGKVKSIATDAYNFIKTPYDFLIQEPISALGHSALNHSHFMEAFNKAAIATSETVYALNTLENVVVHSVIFATSAAATWKLGKLKSEDLQNATSCTRDFLHRTSKNRACTYLMTAGAAAVAFATDMPIVQTSLAGTALGYAADSILRRSTRSEKTKDMMAGARDYLRDFAQAAKNIPSETSAVIMKSGKALKIKMAAAGASLSAYASLLFSDAAGHIDKISHDGVRELLIHASEIQGAVTAGTVVLGAFLPYNVVEDASQHVIFGLAGSATALFCLAAKKGTGAAFRAIQGPKAGSAPPENPEISL